MKSRRYRYSLRVLFKGVAAVVVVNETQRERLIALGCPPTRVKVISDGVPVESFEPSKNVAIQPCRFLAVGRMVEKKAPLNTVRAFALCAEACEGVTLTMVGGGPLESRARALAKELGVSQSIEFLGAQPNTRVRELLRQAGVFLQHSVTAPDGDEEGRPAAISEAGASGLSVVSTRHAGIPQQVKHGETGFLVAEGDWPAMAEYMIQLAQDPALRERMGAAARKRMERNENSAKNVLVLKSWLRAAAGL